MDNPHEHTKTASGERLDRLLEFLRTDPTNVSLLADTAAAAYDAQCFDCCSELLARYRAQHGPLPATLLNLEGLSAMSRNDFEQALATFHTLLRQESNPVVQYNAAYAAAMLGHFEDSVALLDSRMISAVPHAIALKMRALYHLGRLQELVELASTNPDHDADTEVAGLLAAALLDMGDTQGARQHATVARNNADGLAVLGMLALDEAEHAQAAALFGEALAVRPDNIRARLGTGLTFFAEERFTEAARHLDAAAIAFKTHAGSWIAAGWAHLLDGDLSLARSRFEQAGKVDRGFAEAPGSLAVVDFAQGRLADARHHSIAALRLDRACLSAALAQSLLSSAEGDEDCAIAIREAALNHPLDASGKTIAQALARRAARLTAAAPKLA